MAPKSEIINPNLVIGIRPGETEKMAEMAKLYYGEELTQEEIEEKIDDMEMISLIFHKISYTFDVKKILKIVQCMNKQRENQERLIQNFCKGIVPFKAPDNMNNIDFLAHLLNNITEENHKQIESITGKKKYKLLFEGLKPSFYSKGDSIFFTY